MMQSISVGWPYLHLPLRLEHIVTDKTYKHCSRSVAMFFIECDRNQNQQRIVLLMRPNKSNARQGHRMHIIASESPKFEKPIHFKTLAGGQGHNAKEKDPNTITK
eukprot:6391252-Amphidinium_carterae.1